MNKISNFNFWGIRDNYYNQSNQMNKQVCKGYKNFYMENPHTNRGNKKLRDLTPQIYIHYMRLNHTNLSGCFTIKTCSPYPTTWSMSTTQQSPIALVNTPQPCWKDAGLSTTQDSTLWILLERLGMVWQVRLTLLMNVPP